MNILSLTTVCLSLSIATLFSSRIYQKAEKEINKTFEVSDAALMPLLEKDIDGIEQKRMFRVTHSEGLLGYAYFGEAPSKTDTFEYLVIFNTDFSVKKTKMLAYREDYGGEIGSKRWLKQFLNKTPKDRFAYRQNIAAISGATISVKSMTEAMNTLMISLASWLENGEPNKI